MTRESKGRERRTEEKCGHCGGRICCTYVTQKIDAPRSKADFDHLLWQVSHRGVELFKESGGWYLLFRSPCEHLGEDGLCGIYPLRPEVCRAYDNDWCELDQPAEENFQLHFTDHAALLAYCRRRFRRWDSPARVTTPPRGIDQEATGTEGSTGIRSRKSSMASNSSTSLRGPRVSGR